MKQPVVGGWWLVVGAAASVLLAGCGADSPIARVTEVVVAPFRAPAPGWYQQPPREPGRLYGVGAGSDRDAAVAAATKDLVNQIEVSITVDDRTRESSSTALATGNDRVERYEAATRSDIRSRSEQRELPGLCVAQQEQVGDRVYVLMVVDRLIWAADLRGRIKACDDRLAAVAAAYTGNQKPSTAAVLLRETTPLLLERDDLIRRLRAADPASVMPPEVVDRVALRRQIQAVLDALTVNLPTEPEFTDLQPALLDAFAKVGIRAAAPDQTGSLRLRLTLRTSTQRIENQVRCDGELRGAIEDAKGRRLAGIQLSDRAGAPAEVTAKERLNQKLAQRLATDLDQRLLTMLQALE